MGQSRASKETQARLQERDAQAYADQQKYLAAATAKTPLEQAVEDSRLKDVNYFNQATPDYSTAPSGMIDPTAFQKAALNRLQSRSGTGDTQMGMYGSDPNLLALSRENAAAHTAEQGAGDYASQLAARRAEAYGGADASIGLNVNRALSLAGLTSNTAAQAGTNLANFRPTPSMWGQLALAGIGAAGQAAGGYFSRP